MYASLNSNTSNKAGMAEVYETLLKVGKDKKTCQACNRHMDDRELAVFEKFVRFHVTFLCLLALTPGTRSM
jgi:DNA repair protein RAD50